PIQGVFNCKIERLATPFSLHNIFPSFNSAKEEDLLVGSTGNPYKTQWTNKGFAPDHLNTITKFLTHSILSNVHHNTETLALIPIDRTGQTTPKKDHLQTLLEHK